MAHLDDHAHRVECRQPHGCEQYPRDVPDDLWMGISVESVVKRWGIAYFAPCTPECAGEIRGLTWADPLTRTSV